MSHLWIGVMGGSLKRGEAAGLEGVVGWWDIVDGSF